MSHYDGMGPLEVAEALEYLVPLHKNIYLSGPPRIYKTSVVNQVAQKLGIPLIVFRAATREPTDISGLPWRDGERTKWLPGDFIPLDPDWHGIIFLDELPQAAPLMQSACMSLIDRFAGSARISHKAVFIAAGNRVEDRAGSHRIITPLIGRFVTLNCGVNVPAWLQWAFGEGNVNPEVTGYIRFKNTSLYAFDAAVPGPYASPYSWVQVSDVLPSLGENGVRHSIVAGYVGAGHASEFMHYLEVHHRLPDIDELLKHPEDAEVPSKPDIRRAVLASVASRCREAKWWKKVMQYVVRFPREFAADAFQDCWSASMTTVEVKEGRDGLQNTPALKAWLKDENNRKLFRVMMEK